MGLVPQYTRHISQTNIHVCFVDAVFFGSGYFNLGIRTHLEAHMYTVHPSCYVTLKIMYAVYQYTAYSIVIKLVFKCFTVCVCQWVRACMCVCESMCVVRMCVCSHSNYTVWLVKLIMNCCLSATLTSFSTTSHARCDWFIIHYAFHCTCHS